MFFPPFVFFQMCKNDYDQVSEGNIIVNVIVFVFLGGFLIPEGVWSVRICVCVCVFFNVLLLSFCFGFSFLQMFRSKLDSDAGQSVLRPKVSAGLSPPYGTATLGRNTPTRVHTPTTPQHTPQPRRHYCTGLPGPKLWGPRVKGALKPKPPRYKNVLLYWCIFTYVMILC